VEIDFPLSLAGLVVGMTVGLTGMGGGALMTPLLVLVFKVEPLAAVSSDLVASFVMKPIGGGVHLRRGTVNLRLAGWLCMGSVPAAFAGVLLVKALGDGDGLQDAVQVMLGAALLLAASMVVAKAVVQRRRADAHGDDAVADIEVRPLLTVGVGLLGGLIVGMTSVGSGSLMIVLLLMLYPKLTTKSLVGTDLVQAIPLVGSAALGHLLFGDFRLDVAAWLLVGAIPGVYIGARLSAVAPDRVIRPVLCVVLAATGLKLLDVPVAIIGAGSPPRSPELWACSCGATGLRCPSSNQSRRSPTDGRGPRARPDRQGPRRSQRLPAMSRKTATRPYGSARGSVTNSTPAAVIRAYAASKSSTRRKKPTRPATWLPTAPDCCSPSARASRMPVTAPGGRTVTQRFGRPSLVAEGESSTSSKPSASTKNRIAES
jgi:uncharacterized protein